MPYRIAARAAIGGTLSADGGGKFVNGAVTAAFSQLYSEREAWADKRVKGRPLTDEEKADLVGHYEPEVLDSARLYDGRVPWWLWRAMAGVTIDNRIYLRPGHYVPETAKGVRLLAHELEHVRQYRSGMNIFKYLWKSLRGYRQNPYVIEAEDKATEVVKDFCASNSGAAGCVK